MKISEFLGLVPSGENSEVLTTPDDKQEMGIKEPSRPEGSFFHSSREPQIFR
jgi:hypothetical protein